MAKPLDITKELGLDYWHNTTEKAQAEAKPQGREDHRKVRVRAEAGAGWKTSMTNHGHNPKEIDMTTQTTTDRIRTETYTDQQATDEAVLLLVRKLRRLHPDTYVDLMAKLPEGARQALNFADIRADKLRATDQATGIAREYVDAYADLDDEEAEIGDDD